MVVALLQGAKNVPQVYGLAVVKRGMHVHLYRQLRLDIDFNEDILVLENGCAGLQADLHTAAENNFSVDVKDANEEVDDGTDLERLREGIGVCKNLNI